MVDYGRKVIYTDVPVITSENIIPILQKAMPVFTKNASRCDFLLKYEVGNQPLKRKKTYREDINIEVCDNVASEVTEFKLGFNWGNPITIVQRGEKDSGSKDEALAISLLNECYEAENFKSKQQQLARFVEICGIGYTLIDVNNEYEDGDSYFTLNILDPRWTFVVRSSYYIDKRVMIAVSFRKDEIGNYHFTCFTKDDKFEILNMAKFEDEKPVEETERDWKNSKRWKEQENNRYKNRLGVIPIIEWIRAYDRTGCFERQIDEMDNLNILVSDFTNDVDQNTQAIWHGNDVEFPVDENGDVIHPQTNEWIITRTTQDGKTPFVNPLAVNYDYDGILNNIQYRRDMILQKCNVPKRSDLSGGSTGSATSQAAGWEAAEASACKEENIVSGCKMEEIKVVLKAIEKSLDIKKNSPLLKLRAIDVQPNIKRQKTYEMVTKSTCLGNLLSHGVDGLHALKAINLFEDVNQVWEDSKEMITKYQKSLFDKSEPQNNSGDGNKDDEEKDKEKPKSVDGGDMAQITNSPLLDGMSNQKLDKPEK